MLEWLYHFVFPATVNESSCFFTSLPTFDVSFSEFWSFLIGVSYSFKKICVFLMSCETFSHVPICHLYMLFGEVSVKWLIF